MTITTFESIHERIKHYSYFINKSRNDQTPSRIQALITFWRLGRIATLADTASKFGLGKGTVTTFTNRVLTALMTLWKDKIRWPTAEQR